MRRFLIVTKFALILTLAQCILFTDARPSEKTGHQFSAAEAEMLRLAAAGKLERTDWFRAHREADWINGPYPVPDPANPPVWANNSIGLGDTVPAPWTPVAVGAGNLSVWGRKYEFGGNFAPKRITSQETDLFAGPIRINLALNGEKIDLGFAGDAKETRKASEYSKKTTTEFPGGSIGKSITVDYAGLILLDLEIAPQTEVSVDELTIEIPFRKEAARWFSTPTPYDFQAHEHDYTKFTESFKEVGDTEHRLPYSYMIWVGNHRVGLEFLCATSAFWSAPEKPGAITVRRDGEKVVLAINVVKGGKKLGQRFTYRFGLMPTPTKPLPAEFRRIVYFGAQGHNPNDGRIERLNYDLRNPIGIQWGNEKWGLQGKTLSYPLKKDMGLYNRVVENFKRMKMRRILYNDLRGVPAFGEFDPVDWWKVWSNDYERFLRDRIEILDGKSNWISADHERTREIPIFYEHKSFADYDLYIRTRNEREYNHGGVYFDIAPPTHYRKNEALGIPYKGEEDKLYYDVWGRYTYQKRLYTAMRAEKPDWFIMVNSHKLPAITGTFIDAQLCGEGFSRGFFIVPAAKWRPLKSGFRLTGNEYDPDYTKTPLVVMESGYLQTLGFRIVLHPQILKWNNGWTNRNPDWVRERTRWLYSRTLLYDVPVQIVRLDTEFAYDVLAAFDRFGEFDGTEKYTGPFDIEKTGAKIEGGLKYCLYEKSGRTLLIASNPSDAPAEGKIKLGDGIPAAGKAVDLMNKQDVPYDNATFGFRLEKGDFRMIMIEGGK